MTWTASSPIPRSWAESRASPAPGIPVTTILGLLWEGVSAAEILGYYPQLDLDDVDACVQYATPTADEPGLDVR